MNVIIGTRTWWYLFQHPITDEIFPVEQRFCYNHRNGEWELPRDQSCLPNMADGSDLYETRESAVTALLTGAWESGEMEGGRDALSAD